jgi:hypothetical protein
MILGTAVKVTSTVTVDGGGDPDSVTISIFDPEGTAEVTDEAMTGSNPYSYIYQSETDDVSGTYKAEITATSGAYVGFSRIFFTLKGEVT